MIYTQPNGVDFRLINRRGEQKVMGESLYNGVTTNYYPGRLLAKYWAFKAFIDDPKSGKPK